MTLGNGRAMLLLGFAIVLWGTGFQAHSVGSEYASPVAFAALRVLPAAALLVLVAVFSRGRITTRQTVWAVVTGLLMVGVTLGGISEAIERAGAANAAVVFNGYPLIVALLARWFLDEGISPAGVAGLVIGFAGLVILVLAQVEAPIHAPNLLGGIALAVAVALAWAGGTIQVTLLLRREPDVDVLSFTAVQHVAGGAVLAAVVLASGDFTEVRWGAGELWISVAWVAIGSSALATLAFFGALRRMPASTATSWQFLVPVVAVLVEMAIGRFPPPAVLIGMALAIAGVMLTSRSGAQQQLEPARAS